MFSRTPRTLPSPATGVVTISWRIDQYSIAPSFLGRITCPRACAFMTSLPLLETQPIFHKFAATIRGHIFVSFLALV